MAREFIPLKGRQLALVEHLEAENERLLAQTQSMAQCITNLTMDREGLRAALREIRTLQEHNLTDAWSIALRAVGDVQKADKT